MDAKTTGLQLLGSALGKGFLQSLSPLNIVLCVAGAVFFSAGVSLMIAYLYADSQFRGTALKKEAKIIRDFKVLLIILTHLPL